MGKCGIHGMQLKSGAGEIRFGMPPVPPAGYEKANINSFPNANSWQMGGCVVDRGEATDSKVAFCSACRVAEKKWEDEHGVDGFWKS